MSRAEEKRMPSRATNVAYLLLAVATAACAGAPARGLHATPPGLGRLPYTDADVDFMSGMIPHHAQAVIMAGWAPSHGARTDVAILCERIVVAQLDEIATMQTWLRDRRHLDAPQDEDERRRARNADAWHAERRGDGRARSRARPGVRSPVPGRHDQ